MKLKPQPNHVRSRRWITLALFCACLPAIAHGQKPAATRTALVSPALPTYLPQPVAQPVDRGYVLPDGSVRIVGFDDMNGMVARWNAEFTRTHPGIRFTPILKGNGTAIPAITYDMTLFAPEGGGATLLELLPYEKIYGSKKDPVAALIIRVAHGSLTPGAKMSPLAIVTNKSNSLPDITQEQVARIFSTGAGTGDITSWQQLGHADVSDGKAIHPVGLYWDAYQRPEDEYMGEYMMYRHFGPFPGHVFSPNYRQYLTYREVAAAVAQDRSAIGILPLNQVTRDLRVVPMPATDGKGMTTGSAEDIIADRYPYPRDLYLYIRREPGTPLDPLVVEYVKLVLSRQGQEAVARDDKGYLPLNVNDVQDGLDRLEAAKTWAPRSKQGPKLNFPFPSPEPLGK